MVNDRARIGAWGAEVGCGNMQGSVCLHCLLGLICLTRITALQNWRGTDPHASSPPAPTPNKTKSQNGQPVAQHLPTRPPAKKSHLPCQHPLASTTGQKRGKARQGKAHPTRSQQPTVHSFCIFDIAVATDECCTSCDQIAVSVAQRDSALCHLHFLAFIFHLLVDLLRLFCTSRYPAPNQHTKRVYETSLSV